MPRRCATCRGRVRRRPARLGRPPPWREPSAAAAGRFARRGRPAGSAPIRVMPRNGSRRRSDAIGRSAGRASWPGNVGIRLVWRVCNALTSGALAEELPERVDITTRQKLKVAPGAVTRTLDHFGFRGGPALALLDFDPNGVPLQVPKFLTAITKLIPVLATPPR